MAFRSECTSSHDGARPGAPRDEPVTRLSVGLPSVQPTQRHDRRKEAGYCQWHSDLNAHQVTTAHDLALLAMSLLRDYPSDYPLFSQRSVTIDGKRRGTVNGIQI